MAQYPENLSYFDTGSIARTTEDNLIRSSVSIGPEKVRRRTTGVEASISATATLNGSQVSDLESFYNVITAGGSLSFDMIDPVTKEAKQARFAKPPEYSSIGAGTFKAKLQFTLLP